MREICSKIQIISSLQLPTYINSAIMPKCGYALYKMRERGLNPDEFPPVPFPPQRRTYVTVSELRRVGDRAVIQGSCQSCQNLTAQPSFRRTFFSLKIDLNFRRSAAVAVETSLTTELSLATGSPCNAVTETSPLYNDSILLT